MERTFSIQTKFASISIMRNKVILLTILILSSFTQAFADEVNPYLTFFKAKHDQSFFSKLFSKKNTHSELIITQRIRKTHVEEFNSKIEEEEDRLEELYKNDPEKYEDIILGEKYELLEVPEWDYKTNYVKVIIFKKPSSIFSSAKDLEPIKYGLADADDKIICQAENAGTYEFSEEDIEYLKRAYEVQVDKNNRHAFISYYQPFCLIDEKTKKRLIAFKDKDKTEVTVLKFNRDFYNTLIRKDYNWIDPPTEELQ